MRLIDKTLKLKIKLFGIEMEFIDFLFAMVMLTFALAARLYFYDIVSGDYALSFADWMKEIQTAHANGQLYIGITPGVTDASTFDYNCMYQYLMCFISLFHGLMSDMYLVKTASVVFDYVAAITVFRIIHYMSKDVKKAMLAMSVTLMLPTVILNGAAWAQNDIIYTTFILLSFYWILRKRDLRAFIYFAIAYTFKQQAIFFLPFIIILWFKNRVKIRYILTVPVIYFLSLVPAWAAGRNLSELLGRYGTQAQMFSRLSSNYPNIYTVITSELGSNISKELIPCGMMITVLIFGAFVYYLYDKKFKFDGLMLLTLAAFTIELLVVCLPCMHERYAFIAEIFLFMYALYGVKRLAVAVGFEVLSMITYSRFLFGSTVKLLYPLAAINLCLILYLAYDLYKQIKRSEKVCLMEKAQRDVIKPQEDKEVEIQVPQDNQLKENV